MTGITMRALMSRPARDGRPAVARGDIYRTTPQGARDDAQFGIGEPVADAGAETVAEAVEETGAADGADARTETGTAPADARARPARGAGRAAR